MALDETTQGNPICEVCGNSGWAMTILWYSERQGKTVYENIDAKEDHHICTEEDCQEEAARLGWHRVRSGNPV